MISITLYGGANEIGGSKILLEDKDAKIYLDFGEPFGFGEDYFYDWLKPRKVNGLEVYFELGLMPKIKKIYNEKHLELTDLKYEKPDIDAVFISHSHSDHTGHLKFLDEIIPVYLGHGTKAVMDAYKHLYPQFTDHGKHEAIHTFKSGDKIKVKHLTIEPIHVEHSVPGAYGFIIHTSKGPLVYTGDFRMHGPKASMTKEFIEKASLCNPYAMLCEGTRMTPDAEHNYTEKEVEERASSIIKDSKGLVLAYFAMTNVDRFMSFYHAAVKNNRILVVDTRLAYILDCFKEKISALPDVFSDENIRVYYRLSKSCTFCDKDYYPWEREYFSKKITYEEINKNPLKYVIHSGFNKLMELIYLKPENADFIYSSSEHFLEGEDNEEMRTVLENWMGHFNIKFHKTHCSGHASKNDLVGAIKKINPNILIPVHTQNSEEFKKHHSNVIIPEKGKRIEI
ncbi:MBL fold metallo-hydrolase [Candidatus Micrarchaeota archaeon]|nr:MBL fold metallo-hydrolase [Candidatus Micrarchaeota archaeon]